MSTEEDPANDPMEEEEDEESEDESSYDSEDDDSSMDSETAQEAERLMAVLREGRAEGQRLRAELEGAPPPQKSPREKWDEFIKGVATNTNASLKITDELVSWVGETVDEGERAALVDLLCNDVIRASQMAFVLIHAIFSRVLLSMMSPQQQEQMFQAVLSKHAKTLTYWKLGSDDSTDVCGIPTTALLKLLSNAEFHNLTEFEVRGMELETPDQVQLLLSFLIKAPKIRQFNLLGMVMSDVLVKTSGLFDPIVAKVETIHGFDELQLCRTIQEEEKTNSTHSSSLPPLISPEALEHLFTVKVKWWRMAFDGMSFRDQHVQIIGSALKASDACKMNDLLSLQHNPQVTAKGWESLYRVCLHKQRMGLVLSDDPNWVAIFDLVRPLNNLHRRLEYMEGGTYKSKEAWIEYLSVIGNLGWIGEARKLNYLWFALLEAPKLIHE